MDKKNVVLRKEGDMGYHWSKVDIGNLMLLRVSVIFENEGGGTECMSSH